MRDEEDGSVAADLSRARHCLTAGDWNGAERACAAVLDRSPDHAGAWQMRAAALVSLGRDAAALAALDRVAALSPGAADPLYNRGVVLGRLGRIGEAIDSYGRAIAADPRHHRAYNNLAELCQGLGDLSGAETCARAAVTLCPDYPFGHNTLGNARRDQGDLTGALESFDRAIAADPGFAAAHSNRGMVLERLGRHAEAFDSLERAVALRPDLANAHLNRGMVLERLGRHEAARDAYRRAIALAPDFAEPHVNLALCSLLVGDFATGWAEFEWRWRSPRFPTPRRDFAPPRWDGGAPRGRTILLHAEQGLGDTLQFARYVPLVAGLGARIVIEADHRLAPLLAEIDGVGHAVARGDDLPPFDCHCPLMSLPLAFATTPATIPPPLAIRPDPARDAAWAARLGGGPRPRVGFAWSGNPKHQRDGERSIPLALFAPLIAGGVTAVSLQPDIRPGDAAALASLPMLRHFGQDLADFRDTAALVRALDAVVCVDSSVAHLAASLGVPTWLLLPPDPDWRWRLDRADSAWYPSARLVRQARGESWDAVLARLNGLCRPGGAITPCWR